MSSVKCRWKGLLFSAIAVVVRPAVGDEPATSPDAPRDTAAAGGDLALPLPGLRRLSPRDDAWIDPKNKQVVLRGTVVLRRGELEYFACLKQTKEHESIVAVDAKAYVVHAALLACGAVPGNPAQFFPQFTPPRGSEIEITILWTGADGRPRKMDARRWIRNRENGKTLEKNWVFGGSSFWTDPADGKRYYRAEDGDLICTANFPSAMLDVPFESSAAAEAILFEAFTDAIPAEGTTVWLVLNPLPPPAGARPAPPAAEPAAPPASNGT